jgi:hypothetical protein
MKLNQWVWSGIFTGVLAGVFGVLLTGCCAVTGLARPSAVQIDLGSLLNARVVITQKDGRLQMADHGLDRGDSSILITQSAAEISGAAKLNPLPDSGFFAANNEHSDVQLPYGTVGGGPQVHRSPDKTETYSISIPPDHYIQMQLFFISAAGPTPISVKLQYADGSSDQRVTQVPDFFFLPKAADVGWFVLAGNFGKVNRKGLMTESVHHYIHGFDLNPDSTRVLRQIEVSKKNSGSVLNLFGATGTLSDRKNQ